MVKGGAKSYMYPSKKGFPHVLDIILELPPFPNPTEVKFFQMNKVKIIISNKYEGILVFRLI